MQRKSNSTRINLEQAIAILIQNQAAFLANQAAFLASSREIDEWRRKADDRFARIERDLEEIKAILNQLSDLIRNQLPDLIRNQLPELIRQKIGFKTK